MSDQLDGAEPKKKGSQGTMLTRLCQDEAELWHDPDGNAWATVPVGGHHEHHRIRSRSFRTWTRRRFYENEGKSPSAQAVQDAVENLCGIAEFDGDEHRVSVRLAEHAGALYLDLADTHWRAVEITAKGWRVVERPPVHFVRRAGMLSLPEPERGGSLAELRPFVNVSDDDWPLILAFLVSAIRPQGPYAVLNLLGEQGSGKTTLARVLRRLIDPNAANVRAQPRDERDLFIAANNAWVVSLNNLSRLSPWLSDALAALATGQGLATRTLYENDEETIFDASRPIILNGIEEVAVRPDLLDRSLLVYLPQIRLHRKEASFWPAFEQVRPRVIGALLDAVSCALARAQHVDAPVGLRMADFAAWAMAAEPALGIGDGAFLAAYETNRATAHDLALEASPVGMAVRDFMETRDAWTGTAGDLHQQLTTDERRASKKWPANGQAMAGALKRCAPALRAAGVDVSYDDASRDPRGRRLWTLSRLDKETTAGNAGTAEGRTDVGFQPGTLAGSSAESAREIAGPKTNGGAASGTSGTSGTFSPTQSNWVSDEPRTASDETEEEGPIPTLDELLDQDREDPEYRV